MLDNFEPSFDISSVFEYFILIPTLRVVDVVVAYICSFARPQVWKFLA